VEVKPTISFSGTTLLHVIVDDNDDDIIIIFLSIGP
jgi:hypothetical protein